MIESGEGVPMYIGADAALQRLSRFSELILELLSDSLRSVVSPCR